MGHGSCSVADTNGVPREWHPAVCWPGHRNQAAVPGHHHCGWRHELRGRVVRRHGRRRASKLLRHRESGVLGSVAAAAAVHATHAAGVMSEGCLAWGAAAAGGVGQRPECEVALRWQRPPRVS